MWTLKISRKQYITSVHGNEETTSSSKTTWGWVPRSAYFERVAYGRIYAQSGWQVNPDITRE